MIKAINPEEISEYICEQDRNSENPTVWKLGVLDSRIMGFIDDTVTKLEYSGKGRNDPADPVFITGTRRWLLVKYGLRGWSNFFNIDGNPITEKFDSTNHFGKTYPTVSDDVLRIIPVDVIAELAAEIQKQNKLTPEEKVPLV